MLQEIGRPDIIDMIIKLGHRIAVPSAVMEKELVRECVCRMVGELVARGQISVLRACPSAEVRALQHEYPEIGLGECEVILHCQRSGDGVYGILDDKQARAAAEALNIRYTGLAGLIKRLSTISGSWTRRRRFGADRRHGMSAARPTCLPAAVDWADPGALLVCSAILPETRQV